GGGGGVATAEPTRSANSPPESVAAPRAIHHLFDGRGMRKASVSGSLGCGSSSTRNHCSVPSSERQGRPPNSSTASAYVLSRDTSGSSLQPRGQIDLRAPPDPRVELPLQNAPLTVAVRRGGPGPTDCRREVAHPVTRRNRNTVVGR